MGRVLKSGTDLQSRQTSANHPRGVLPILGMCLLWNAALTHASSDLTDAVQIDAAVRYVDALPDPHVPSYIAMDLRFAWSLTDWIELSLVGQNLFDERHLEFIPSSPSAREIERSVYGRIAWRM